MRTIDLASWPRREHFEYFNTWDYPHFSLCANVDIMAFYRAVKLCDVSFTVATMYVLGRCANAIPEFRHRIRGDQVVEHDVVHPGTTILLDDDRFSFCIPDYSEDFAEFAACATAQIARVRADPVTENDPGRDDVLYTTSIPWVSFTSMMHPLILDPVDSIPRFAWGKFFLEGDRLKMPLSVQGHHAVMDGLHAGRFYERAQELFSDPVYIVRG